MSNTEECIFFFSDNVRCRDLSDTIEYFLWKEARRVSNDGRFGKLECYTNGVVVRIIEVVSSDSFGEDNFRLFDEGLGGEDVVDSFRIWIVSLFVEIGRSECV